MRRFLVAVAFAAFAGCTALPQPGQSAGVAPSIPGNSATLIRTGESAFDAIWSAIEAAQDHVNLEFFIFEDVTHRGRSIVDLLIRKRRAGVQVNLIYDAVGSDQTPGEVFDRLRDAGVAVVQFNPIVPGASGRLVNPNHRDHRKIAVADGRLAVIGGINISEVYLSSGGSAGYAGKKKQDKGKPPEKWRDTDLLIKGPAVAELQKLFLATWKDQTGEEPAHAAYYPTLAPTGLLDIEVIGSSPDDAPAVYYAELLAAMQSAKSRVWITNAYFAPTKGEVEQLLAAAKRGVDVRLLLQGQSDAPRVRDIGRSYYAAFLEAGVRIWELEGEILHSKTATIDGAWAAVGSSNFDGRSIRFNDEVDTIVHGPEIAGGLEKEFESAAAKAKVVTQKEWADRPLWQKLREHLSRAWAYWM
jgi:cardiolipin synthase